VPLDILRVVFPAVHLEIVSYVVDFAADVRGNLECVSVCVEGEKETLKQKCVRRCKSADNRSLGVKTRKRS
jgi:hypothetical protein